MHFFLFTRNENRLTRKDFSSGNEQNTENTSRIGLSYCIINDDNVCTSPIMANKDILEFVQSSKNIIDADYDKNETNNAAPVPITSEMRNVMKSMRSYLDAHSNGEVNSKMLDIAQFDAKKSNAKKNIRLFSKH
ncbi:hypothetical protein TNCV_89101 [Trichonephila clavipes]|nr:hypothetical protein TNCV_89101 [Trichonephila clavipes]